MARCSICALPEDTLVQINKKIRDGKPDLHIAKEYNVSRDAIRRHRINEHHVPAEDKALREVANTFEVVKTEQRDVTMQDAVSAILAKLDYFNTVWLAFMEKGAYKSAVDVHKEIRQTMQLLYNLKGWLKTDSTVVQVQINTQLDSVADKIIAALEPYPEALRAVRAAMEGMRDVTE